MNNHQEIPYFRAVLAMGFCVFLLIAAEFLPVSLLVPMAKSLKVPEGLMGQSVSISGFFAVLASLLIGPLTARIDRKSVLIFLVILMSLSLLGGALSYNIFTLMMARATLGIAIGGFWALCTAIVMKMVPHSLVPRALGIVYTGNAVAVAFAPPLSSWSGDLFGWRVPFWALVPAGVFCVFWLLLSLPKLETKIEKPVSLGSMFALLLDFKILKNMTAIMFSFLGAFCAFTYFRVFLETKAGLSAESLSWAFFTIGVAAFVGTSLVSKFAGKYLNLLLGTLPLILAFLTVALIGTSGHLFMFFAVLILWGALNAAIPVAWSSWLARDVKENPEAGGGLMVAVIQLSIMLGGTLGGVLLDKMGIEAAFEAGSLALLISALLAGLPLRKEKCL